MMFWVAIAAIVTAAAIVVFVTRRNRGETIVLGQQVADARANEAARLASGSVGPSPMPKGEYDQEGGEYDLAAVTELPLDRELQGLLRAFKAWTPETRAEVRVRISMDEQYTLVHFAKRCTVLAPNGKSIARAEDGLLALAMIDETRIDPRDGTWAVGCLRMRSRRRAQTGSVLRMKPRRSRHPGWRRSCCARRNPHDWQSGAIRRYKWRMAMSACCDQASSTMSLRLTWPGSPFA